MNFRFVQLALQAAEEYGVVTSRQEGWTESVVIALEDDPASAFVRRELIEILDALIETRMVELVGIEGAFGSVDTSWLGDATEDELLQTMCDGMLDALTLSPAQYCHVFSRMPFALVGLEDKDAYRECVRLLHELPPLAEFHNAGPEGPTKDQLDAAGEHVRDLYPEVAEYDRVQEQRAELMMRNLVAAMIENGLQAAAVVASAPVLDRLCACVADQGMSFARIEPGRREGDLDAYERRLREQSRVHRDRRLWADA